MEHPVDAKEALRQFHEKQTYHYLGGQKDQVAVLKKKLFFNISISWNYL